MSEVTNGHLKIVNLIAENVKKLRAVEITPTGEIVKIVGANDQGKTTVLDSIWMALDHSRVPAVMPIRKGENKARIRLDLGEIIVERRFTDKTSTLTVESAKGARFPSPQKMLDALIGELSFDPLAFSRMAPKDQFDELRRVSQLDVDIEELDRLNAGDFGKRTDVNRDVRAKRAQAEGIVVAAGLPDAPLDEDALITEITQAGEQNAQLEQRKGRRADATRDIEAHRKNARERRDAAAEMRRKAESEERAAIDLESLAADLQKKLDEAPALPGPVDVAAIRVRHEHARQVNAKLELRNRRRDIEQEALGLEAQAQELTERIAGREKAKADAIAKAKMPVDGLGFGAGDKPFITYQDIPFEQASTSVKLKVSLAIAMAANPKLRVIRIQDASLLDEASMKQIAEMAREHDYQLWCEVVDTTGKVGIVIEDGSVIAVDGEKVPPSAEKKSTKETAKA